MSAVTIGLIGVGVLFILLALKQPVSFSLAIVGLAGYLCIQLFNGNNFDIAFNGSLQQAFNGLWDNFSSYSLSVIPMFVWMGFLAYYSGIGTDLYSFAYKMIGHWPGGLAVANQLACGFFSAICGSNNATAATMGAISLPEMKKYKYDDSLATASIAAGGVLGALIPPSVVFIVYGMATEQSIGRLFISGIIPGIMLMFLYIGAIVILTIKNPNLGPKGPKAGWKERLSTLNKGLWETLGIFIISMGGLILGLFTPTEAGAVGVGGVLLMSLIRKRMSWKKLSSSLIDTTRTTAMIMMLIAGANIFGKFMAVSKIPLGLASWTAALPFPPAIVMGIIILIYLVLGLFIDALALVLLTVPIFFPVVKNLGYDPIWFGVIMVLVVGMGVITPPVGIHVFIIKGIAKDVPLETIYKGIWPFLICILITIAVLIFFPSVATFLPDLVIK